MRVTSRSILAAGTISAAALIGAGITVFGADDPDVSGRLQPLGPSTTADNITVPRSVASSTIIDVDDATDGSRRSRPTTTPATTPADERDHAGDDADVGHRPRRLGSRRRRRPDVTVRRASRPRIDDDDDDGDDNSGPGHGGDDDHDNSGPGHGGGRRLRPRWRRR